MGVGTFVRHRLGRLEIPAANLYRSVFINLQSLADQISAIAPARRILEVGCGDGSLGEQLMRVYPEATYFGIDVASTAGRLYRGDPRRATFRTVTVQDHLAEQPDPYDVVVLVDVLHHVPPAIRAEVLAASARLVKPGGYLMVKDWERNRRPHHYLAYAADRYVTGDKGVSFMTLPEFRSMVDSLDGFGPTAESTVAPVRNNVLLSRRKAG